MRWCQTGRGIFCFVCDPKFDTMTRGRRWASPAPSYNHHKWRHHLSTIIPNVFAKKLFAIINIVIIIVVIGEKLIFSSPPHHLLLGSLRLFLLNRLQQDFLMEIHNWRWFWWWGVIADYESEGSIKSVDNNMTITTIMTMMKMLKMTVTGMTVTILKMLQRLMKTSVWKL